MAWEKEEKDCYLDLLRCADNIVNKIILQNQRALSREKQKIQKELHQRLMSQRLYQEILKGIEDKEKNQSIWDERLGKTFSILFNKKYSVPINWDLVMHLATEEGISISISQEKEGIQKMATSNNDQENKPIPYSLLVKGGLVSAEQIKEQSTIQANLKKRMNYVIKDYLSRRDVLIRYVYDIYGYRKGIVLAVAMNRIGFSIVNKETDVSWDCVNLYSIPVIDRLRNQGEDASVILEHPATKKYLRKGNRIGIPDFDINKGFMYAIERAEMGEEVLIDGDKVVQPTCHLSQ